MVSHGLICIFPLIHDMENFFICLMVTCMYSFEKYLFMSFVHFNGVVCFCLLICLSSYILNIIPLLDAQFANIFSHSVGCLFTLLAVYFAVQMLFRLIRSHLSIFLFVVIAFGVFVMKSLPGPMFYEWYFIGILSPL